MMVTAKYVDVEPSVELVLSKSDARTLKAIVSRINGPETGPRGTATRIWDALEGINLSGSVLNTKGSWWIE